MSERYAYHLMKTCIIKDMLPKNRRLEKEGINKRRVRYKSETESSDRGMMLVAMAIIKTEEK